MTTGSEPAFTGAGAKTFVRRLEILAPGPSTRPPRSLLPTAVSTGSRTCLIAAARVGGSF